MQKLTTLFSIAMLSLMLVIQGCKKDKNDDVGNEPDAELLDPVDDELNAFLASIPSDTSINTLDLIFDDGSSIIDFIQQNDPDFLNEHNVFKTSQTLTPEQQKKLLIGRMSLVARSFVIRKNWENISGSNQPNGLAYNWGSKNHKVAQKPAEYKGNPNKCQEKLFGLDCSGMIYQMALNAGINLAQGGASAEFERDTANWNNKFRQSTKFKDLKANLYKHTGVPSTDPSYIDINGLKEGDLIFKTNNGKAVHVGMVLRVDLNAPKSLSIYQSNGKPDMGCDLNKSDKCGPRIISLSSAEAFGSGTLFGIDWQVVRFEAIDNELMLTGGSQRIWYGDTGSPGDGSYEFLIINSDHTGQGGSDSGTPLFPFTVHWTFNWEYNNGILHTHNMKYLPTVNNGEVIGECYTTVSVSDSVINTYNVQGGNCSYYVRGTYLRSSIGM